MPTRDEAIAIIARIKKLLDPLDLLLGQSEKALIVIDRLFDAIIEEVCTGGSVASDAQIHAALKSVNFIA